LGLDYKLDIEKSKKLLQDAGHSAGLKLKVVSSMRDHYLINYESLRDQLANLGIEVEIETVEHREMHKRIRADENPIVIYVAWRPNADTFLTRFFHSDSIVVTGASPDTNFSHYRDIPITGISIS
jgi:peptide/nickel transport system substrate-binding protein